MMHWVVFLLSVLVRLVVYSTTCILVHLALYRLGLIFSLICIVLADSHSYYEFIVRVFPLSCGFL